MRFLKNRILRAREAHERSSTDTTSASPQISASTPETDDTTTFSHSIASLTRTSASKRQATKENSQPKLSPQEPSLITNEAKNIALNYGKAISTFALSAIAKPYLKLILGQLEIDMKDFLTFAACSKTRIVGITTFRNLLLVDNEDDEKTAALKAAFRVISEVFIKYFSVNWITHGRVTNKMLHLKYRAKMLRRVQNPESFTYMIKRGSKK